MAYFIGGPSLAFDDHGGGGAVVVHVEVQCRAQVTQLEEVVAADIVGGQIGLFTVDLDALLAGDGGGGFVRAGSQLASSEDVGIARFDNDSTGRRIKVHAELGAGAVEKRRNVAELEVVGAVDVVDFGVLGRAVDGEVLLRQRDGGTGGGRGGRGRRGAAHRAGVRRGRREDLLR